MNYFKLLTYLLITVSNFYPWLPLLAEAEVWAIHLLFTLLRLCTRIMTLSVLSILSKSKKHEYQEKVAG